MIVTTAAVVSLRGGAAIAATKICGLTPIDRIAAQCKHVGIPAVVLRDGDQALRLRATCAFAARGVNVVGDDTRQAEPAEILYADCVYAQATMRALGERLRGRGRNDVPSASAGASASAGVAVEHAVHIEAPGDIAAAREFLEREIRKSIDLDGAISYYAVRPLANLLARPMLRTPLTPNMVTLMSMACGMGTAALAAVGTRHALLWAGLLYFFGMILDCIDGQIARLKYKFSRHGQWLDSLADEMSNAALIAGLGWGIAHNGGHAWWAIAGVATSMLVVIEMAIMFSVLARRGLPIDLAQFPWFFRQGDAAASASSKGVELVGWLGRRDTNVTGMSILMVLGLPRIACGFLLAGIGVLTLLLLVHGATRWRSGTAAHG